ATTLDVVTDAYEKIGLYLGHPVRVANQQRALQQLADSIKEKCRAEQGSCDAIVVVDFKMKMEPLYYREK
ncbi:hypothetical protein PHYSODRAFT_455482, partial [Phytophthora sojae]